MSKLALKLIAEAKEKHLTTLNLGKCGLTDIPEQLFELVWLEELSLSNEYYEWNADEDSWENIVSKNLGKDNVLSKIPERFSKLQNLKKLILAGELGTEEWKISNVSALSQLSKLNSLDLSSNQISDLSALSQLSKLNFLNLSRNQISDLSALSQLNNLRTLDLGSNQISNLSALSQLSKLNFLDLSRNQISDLSALSQLNKLSALYLSRNQISNLSILSQLNNLRTLDLSRNQISNLSILSQLSKLNFLDLSSNQISNLSALSQLSKLNFLDLNRNKISDLSALSQLSKLRSLDLSNNQISDLSVLSQLSKLKSLYLISNQISNLSILSQLSDLSALYLSDNQISDLSVLSQLSNLRTLDLSNNQISDLSVLSQLSNLRTLDFSSNQINDLTPLVLHIKKGIDVELELTIWEDEIIVGDNPLETPPIAVIEQGNKAILSYFKDIEEQGSDKLNEAKLIIVGEPEAGKTSLMEMLLDPKYQLSDTKSTLGVEVRRWQFPHPDKKGASFTANIWDFGGQQIQYMTHQFFLTPSAAYVLVSANDRKESVNFPYWFKIIHLLGEEKGRYSPVLVVLNEKNDEFVNKLFDLNAYQTLYPELQIEVCQVDLSKRDGKYQALNEMIKKQLTQLSHVTDPRPARWNDIRGDLQTLANNKDHINFSQYASVCERYKVSNETSQMVLSGYLHRLGSLLHFSNDPALRDFIILNPQWAVDAVYSVLADKEISDNDGYFTQDKLDAIWKGYSVVERDHLLNLMKQENFEICYAIEGKTNTYIAPQLLNERQPHYAWDSDGNADSLKFRFRYKFMPEGVITRMVVRMNHLIAKGDDCDLVWRKGVVLNQNGCLAQVKEEENRDGLKVIDIAVTGDVNKRKFLLHSIREQVQEIHSKWFRNIQAEQMIPCHCETCITSTEPTYFEHSELEQYQSEGVPDIYCRNGKVKRVNVISLLEGFFGVKEIQRGKYAFNQGIPQEKAGVVNNFFGETQVGALNTGDSHKVSGKVKSSPASKDLTTENMPSKWYQEWWIITLVIAGLSGIITGFSFTSLYVGVAALILTGLVVYTLNPKRRFMHAGLSSLGLAGFSSVPLFSGKIGLNPDIADGKFGFLLNWGEPTTPWLIGLLVVLAAFLFWLDSRQ